MKKKLLALLVVLGIILLSVAVYTVRYQPETNCGPDGKLCSTKTDDGVRPGQLEKAEAEKKQIEEPEIEESVAPVKGEAQVIEIKSTRRVHTRPGSSSPVRRGVLATARTPWTEHANRYLVLDREFVDGEEWVKILLPIKPNNSTGWIPLTGAEKIMITKRYVRISLADRKLFFYRNGKLEASHKIVIGARKSPTPKGLMAVQDVMASADPNEFTGSRVIVLTSFSETLDTFEGAPPRIAIHGRGGQSFDDPLGTARSNGCIRLNNKDIEKIALYLRPGDPVWIE